MAQKYVYIVHPFFGDTKTDPRTNYEKIGEIARLIRKNEPDVVVLSPAHMCGWLWTTEDPCTNPETLGTCIEYMEIADEVRVFGEYTRTLHCMAEIERARFLGLDIVFEDGRRERSDASVLCINSVEE